jgi:hypothetical protein
MQPSKLTAPRRLAGPGWTVLLTLGAALIVPVLTHAQSRPPLQEPIALEGTMKEFYRGLNIVIVTTMDGVEHVYHFTKDLIVHGGKKPGIDALEDLDKGTTVVIHYRMNGAQAAADEIDVLGEEGLKITEGVVTGIDRRRQKITIAFANGKTETLQMTSRVAAESNAAIEEPGEATNIIVYYSDGAGGKVAHHFKKVGDGR